MPKLTDRAYILNLLERYGFSFSKSLGQNFLVNPAIAPKICECAEIDKSTYVLEIGCGIGVLTRELAQRAKKVLCIEIDKRLMPVLEETLESCDNVAIINDDVLKVDIASAILENFGAVRVSVCANLPYYITTPIIMHLLEARLPIDTITVMVQREAAERICAAPGTRECGAVSAAVRYYCEPSLMFNVSKGSFMPAPKVESSVIQLAVRHEINGELGTEFFKVVRAAFSMRRKTLLNCLSAGLGIDKPTTLKLLEAANVPPSFRGEQLTMEQLYTLAGCVCGL